MGFRREFIEGAIYRGEDRATGMKEKCQSIQEPATIESYHDCPEGIRKGNGLADAGTKPEKLANR